MNRRRRRVMKFRRRVRRQWFEDRAVAMQRYPGQVVTTKLGPHAAEFTYTYVADVTVVQRPEVNP